MFTRLRLRNFKSYRDAILVLGPFTLLVGTNASGKSNVRDAFRFLHGIGRGYKLADIFGGKSSEGSRIWTGIRGGPRAVTFRDETRFTLDVDMNFQQEDQTPCSVTYSIEVAPNANAGAPWITQERLSADSESANGLQELLVHTTLEELPESHAAHASVEYEVRNPSDPPESVTLHECNVEYSALTQLVEKSAFIQDRGVIRQTLDMLRGSRFIEFVPDEMRQPSFPGQALGDRGENLSSVLKAMCDDPQQKQTLLRWVQTLTPMDAVDFEFPTDPIGKVLVTLLEANGQRTTAYSASDGTLRFLGMLAAMLGPDPASFYFFEEIENGIHPNRLYLLIELIEKQTAKRNIQVLATTHSPQLLRFVSPASLAHTTLTYRLEDQPDTRMKRMLDIPEARDVIQEDDIAHLYESGWFENTVAFIANETASAEDNQEPSA